MLLQLYMIKLATHYAMQYDDGCLLKSGPPSYNLSGTSEKVLSLLDFNCSRQVHSHQQEETLLYQICVEMIP